MSATAVLFVATLLQSASFTFLSRARNSKSLGLHAVASLASNGIWLLVIRQVVLNLDSASMMATYLVASVVGSVAMHAISMRAIEPRVEGSR